MPRQCPPSVRQELVDGMLAGESVLSLVTEYGVPEQTLHRWKSQARVDAELTDGVTSVESRPLRDAQRRITELEAELALVKAAREIFNAQAVVDPKGGTPSR